MVDRIIEACNTLRVEYHAKLTRQHEEHMMALNKLRNEHHEDMKALVRAAIERRDTEWRDLLGDIMRDAQQLVDEPPMRPH